MDSDTIRRSPHRDDSHSTSSERTSHSGVGFKVLAARLAELGDDDPMVACAWAGIVRIEELLGIQLGAADDHLVVLWRRFGRTHRSVACLPVADPRRVRAELVVDELLATLG